MAKDGMGVYQVIAYLITALVLADSLYHIVNSSDSIVSNSVTMSWDPVSSHQLYNSKTSAATLYTIMSFRIIVSAMFLLTGIFFQSWPRINLLISTIYTLVLLVIMLICCSILQFHRFVPSLIVQILSIYFGFLCWLNQVFAWYQIDSSSDDRETRPKQTVVIVKVLRTLDQNMMAFGTLMSVLIAIVVGVIIRQNDPLWTERQIVYINFIGEVFLRMLKCLILPLIFSSLVFAIGNMDAQLSGKVALRTVVYYMATTFVAIVTGIILVIIIQPGKQEKLDQETGAAVSNRKLTTIDTILDLIRNMFPSNIFEACFAYYSTELTCTNTTNVNCNTLDIDMWTISSTMGSGSNILGVVMFAIVFGVMITRTAERTAMVEFFKGINSTMMELTSQVIRLTPLAVVFLILPQIIKVKDLSVLFGAIGFYTLTVVLGIAFQSFVTLPLIYLIVTRKNPFKLIKHLSPAMITAFGTSSSSATMPVTFMCLEDGAKLDKRIVRFCIPVGATINMDGTALYEAVAAIFIAQYRDVELDLVKIIIITITATAASIGAAGIPQAGLVTMIIVLNAVGLNAEDAALIVVVDWMLDRIRTMINVLGDSFGSAIVHHLSSKEMQEFDNLPPIIASE